MILVSFNGEIKGTSAVSGYVDWIEFDSYSFNASRCVQVEKTDRVAGDPFVSELMLTKGADKTSPELFVQSVAGKSLTTATLVVMHSANTVDAPKVLLEIVLENPIISSFSTQSTSSAQPSEHISVSFTKITYTYNNFKDGVASGSVKKEYSLVVKAKK